MSYISFNEVYDLTLALQMPISSPYNRKTLIESDEQVLAFSQFIKSQQDAIEEKRMQMESLEQEGEHDQELVIGVDCEGISRHKNLALIQVGVSNRCFLFDLTKLNSFPKVLKQVLEDPNIVKVFHDFCEDTSALVRQYNVHCDCVFDTQIAHRLLNKDSDEPRDQNINLNSLLKQYLKVENDQKDVMVNMMKADPELWWKRPLSHEMQEYASQDVLYLPRVYEAMKNLIGQQEKRLSQIRNNNLKNSKQQVDVTISQKDIQSLTDSSSSDQDDVSVSTHYSSSTSSGSQFGAQPKNWTNFSGEIFEKTQLCQRYAYLNRNFPSQFVLHEGTQIKAFVKNFQPFGVFCSLNLGVSGLIKDSESLDFMNKNYKIGDIIDVEVTEEFDSSFDFDTHRPVVQIQLPSSQIKPSFQSHFLSCLAATNEYFGQQPFRFSFNSDFSFQPQQKQSSEGFYFGIDSSNLLTTHKTEFKLPVSAYQRGGNNNFSGQQQNIGSTATGQYQQVPYYKRNSHLLSFNDQYSHASSLQKDKKPYYDKRNRVPVAKKSFKHEEFGQQATSTYEDQNKMGTPPLQATRQINPDHSWRKKTNQW